MDHDAEISGPYLGDSGGNSDGQASENVSRGDDKGNNNDDWALWNENGYYFCKIPFCASPGFKPPQNERMPVSPQEIFLYFFVQLCLKK
jgi:hypothetical protein